LYESTGLPNESSLRIVDLKSGKPLKNHVITDSSVFGEGITIFKNKIFQLTWENKKAFVYNVNDITKPIQILNWPRDGWGITNDGSSLIISDGSDKLYVVNHDPAKSEFQLQKIISVSDNNGPVDSLNELEYINGYLYSNVWLSNDIVKVDLSNGHVVGKINCEGLLNQYAKTSIDKETNVLNGIAYDSASNKVFITGKNWPKLFEISLN
jgi:glutamine cyclotransferase